MEIGNDFMIQLLPIMLILHLVITGLDKFRIGVCFVFTWKLYIRHILRF